METEGVSVTGSLSELPLGRLLEQLAQEQRSGVLRVSNGSEVWFEAGEIYLATNAASPPLESVLYGNGTTPEAEIATMLESGSNTVGADLVAADPDSLAVLNRLVHEFNLTALFELVVPSSHTFEFDDGLRHPVGSQFAEPVDQLVAQAERRLEIWKQIATRIPSVDVVFKLTSGLPDGNEERVVTSDEWRYLSMLDGHTSVSSVITRTGESAFRVCSSLYRLLLEGLLEEVQS